MQHDPQTGPRAARPSDPAAVLLGYLNFSSGAFDPAVWRAMNELFAAVEPAAATGSIEERPDAAARVAAVLGQRLETLPAEAAGFRDISQASAVLGMLFTRLLPAYRRFHGDLLEHQHPGGLQRSRDRRR